jgi:hypothetical protein
LGARELDKFYTNSDGYKLEGEVVEPSAGSGAFAPYVDIMLDIAPEGERIEQADFLEFDSSAYKNYLGNPPFGRNSKLAKEFFNHAAKGKGVIGFIVPLTFRKVSVQNALNLNFHLVRDELLSRKSFTLKGKDYSVPCCFQVWEWREEARKKVVLPTKHEDFEFVKNYEEFDFAIRRVGGLAGKVIDAEKAGAPSSHYFIRGEVRERMESLYERFQEVASNTAGNPSLGKGELIQIYNE